MYHNKDKVGPNNDLSITPMFSCESKIANLGHQIIQHFDKVLKGRCQVSDKLLAYLKHDQDFSESSATILGMKELETGEIINSS